MKHSPLQSFRLLVLCFLAAVAARADTTVPPTTVTSGQTLNVANPGQVITSGSVEVQSGGTATLQGGAAVKLEPGFHASANAFFRALINVSLIDYTVLTDSDGDGLPDNWELIHFGNLTTVNGTGDYDGDGVTNAAEYTAGTNPTVNENTATLPGDAQVVIRVPSGNFQKVRADWSITNAP